MQAEPVDVGTQGLARRGVPWRRAPEGQHLLPSARAEGNAVGNRCSLQRPQGARLLAVVLGLDQVGLAHLLDQHATAAIPADFERDFFFQRMFAEHNGSVWCSPKDSTPATPVYSIRINGIALRAIEAVLGVVR